MNFAEKICISEPKQPNFSKPKTLVQPIKNNHQDSDIKMQHFQFDEQESSKKKITDKIEIKGYVIRPSKFISNTLNGYTTIHSKSGRLVFEGEYLHSRKNGYGIEYDREGGIIYEGYYLNDKFEGWGKTMKYSGEFRDGAYDGYGIFTSKEIYYEGFFMNGDFNGEGVSFKGEKIILFWPVKNIIDYLNQAKINNFDILEKHNIDQVYVGEWKNGLKHGHGKIWKQDYWYSGQFSNGIPHGVGAEENKQKDKGVQKTIYRSGIKK